MDRDNLRKPLRACSSSNYLGWIFAPLHGQHVISAVMIALYGLSIVVWLKGFFPSFWDAFLPPFNPWSMVGRLPYIWNYSLIGGQPLAYVAYLPYYWCICLLTIVFPPNIANTTLYYILFTTSGFSMYLLMLRMARALDEGSKRMCALISSLTYMSYNVIFFLFRPHQSLAFIFALAFFPLLLLTIRESIASVSVSKKRSIEYCLASSLLTVAMSPMAAANLPMTAAIYSFVAVYTLLLCLLYPKTRKQFFFAVTIMILFSMFVLLANLWWIFPHTAHTSAYAGLYRSPEYVSETLFDLKGWIGVSTLPNLLRCMPYSRCFPWFSDVEIYSTPLFILISYLTPLIAFTSLLRKHSSRDVVALALVALFFMPVLAGLNYPFESMTHWLVENVPLYVFRRPEAYIYTIYLPISALFGLGVTSIYDSLSKRKGRVQLSFRNSIKLSRYMLVFHAQLSFRKLMKLTKYVLVFLLVFLVTVVQTFPFWLGYDIRVEASDVNDHMVPISIFVQPPDYALSLSEYLNNLPKPGGVLLLPPDGSAAMRLYNWKHGYFGYDFYWLSLDRPVLSHAPTGYPIRYVAKYVHDVVHRSKITYFANLLTLLGVRYIIVTEDSLLSPTYYDRFDINRIHEFLSEQEDIRLVGRFGEHVLYENTKIVEPQTFYVAEKVLAVFSNFSFPGIQRLLITQDPFEIAVVDSNVASSVHQLEEWAAPSLPQSGIVLSLDFDEGIGDTVYDKSGYNNDGTIYGASWIDGVHGKALSFDGVDDYVEVPDSDSLDLSDSFTLEFWINIGDNVWPPRGILTKGSFSDGNWHTAVSSEWPSYIEMWTVSAAGIESYELRTSFLEKNEWTHVVLVYDKERGEMCSFIDGVLDSARNVGSFEVRTGTWTVKIGKREEGYPFKGVIDEVRIYNRALTAEEIYEQHVQSVTRGIIVQTLPNLMIKSVDPLTSNIQVTNAVEPFLLASSITYDDSWTAKVDGTELKHVEVNGVFNGWVVDEKGNFTIKVYYIKQLYANIFYYISACFVIGSSLVLLLSHAGIFLKFSGLRNKREPTLPKKRKT